MHHESPLDTTGRYRSRPFARRRLWIGSAGATAPHAAGANRSPTHISANFTSTDAGFPSCRAKVGPQMGSRVGQRQQRRLRH